MHARNSLVILGLALGPYLTFTLVHWFAAQPSRAAAILMMFPESKVVVAMLANILVDFGEQDAQKIGSIFSE
ncbi:MAG: hypothetical protein HYZ58_12765 [Acidobacteria bacterium]|nr:hypothetical protein [Acidobacteriota bacterium]